MKDYKNCPICSNRILPKRVNLRVEHVKHSSCRLDFLNRVKTNAEKLKQAKEAGTKVDLKRHVRILYCFIEEIF